MKTIISGIALGMLLFWGCNMLHIFPEQSTTFMFAFTTPLWIWMVSGNFMAILGHPIDEWGLLIHPGKVIITLFLWAVGLVLACNYFHDDELIINSVMMVILLIGVTVALEMVLMIFTIIVCCVLEFLGIRHSTRLPMVLKFLAGIQSNNKNTKIKTSDKEKVVSAVQFTDSLVKVFTTENERVIYGKLIGFTENTYTVSPSKDDTRVSVVYNADGTWNTSYNTP